MTIHPFKNGIEIHIPADLPNQLEEWTKVKVAMSLILHQLSIELEPEKEKKPDGRSTAWPKERRKKVSRTLKAWHRNKKNA